MSETLAQVQSVLKGLDESLEAVQRLLLLSDVDIDRMLDAETPEQVEAPQQTSAQQAIAQTIAQDTATTIKQQLSAIQQAAQTWQQWLEAESQRAVSTAAEAPKATSTETKIVQKVTVVKPPPELPEPFASWLMDIAYILYNYIVAGLTGEIEIKPIDLDRYIDDFMKICELVIRVRLAHAG